MLGGVASVAGTRWTFGAVGVASLALVAWAAVTPAEHGAERQPLALLGRAMRDRHILAGFWFVLLPALLFGTLTVLAPLRLSRLGLGSVAIGAVFLCSAAFEAANNVFVGGVSDRRGPIRPLLFGLVGSTVLAAALPWPGRALWLVPLVACSGVAFGTFFTPGITLLTQLSEARGPRLRLHVRDHQPRLGAGPGPRRRRRRRPRPADLEHRSLPRALGHLRPDVGAALAVQTVDPLAGWIFCNSPLCLAASCR